MSYRIRKIIVEFVRSTSHLRPAFRFEVPILKLVNPTEQINIHPIPNPSPADVHEFAGPREAFLSMQSVYGPKLTEAYIDFEAFSDAFKATCLRDAVGQTVMASAIDASPDGVKLEALSTMGRINGVTPAIAAAMFDTGLRSIEDVARSTLDELEAVAGIGPALSTMIQTSAKTIALGAIGETPQAAPEIDHGTPAPIEPAIANPFA